MVAVDSLTAQEAQPTEDTAQTVESGAAEPVTGAQEASEEDATATSEDNPDKLPPIEITQPAVKEPAQGETAQESEPQVAAVRPAPSRSRSYTGTGGSEGLAGLGESDGQGTGDGAGESAWGPVDGFVASGLPPA